MLFHDLGFRPVLQRAGVILALSAVVPAWLCTSQALAQSAAPKARKPAISGKNDLKLHVASPDWRDQIIYFAMTDRFDDGDASNNDQGAGEFDPSQSSRYSGGDLAGARRRLDYIAGLGATTLWLTPPVRNQWLNTRANYGGYHGYWASHFKQTDPHVGSLRAYQGLSDALHRRGMYLVQDIVLNHVGDHFSYSQRPPTGQPQVGYAANMGSRPSLAPVQAPFHLNDPRRGADRKANVYHWTPDIADYNNRQQELNDQLSGLDDLNTENPRVRRALRDSYGHWIKRVGVDAFRLDTVFYVPPDTFSDFMQSRDRAAPGMRAVAASTGRRDFLVFGEGFAIDKPFDDRLAKKVERYATDEQGEPVLPGMLNFPLYGSLGNVFARGQATSQLAHRIDNMMRTHRAPHLMPTFIDNHDVDRFLAGGSQAALRQATVAMMTLPGIPTLYYGTEQGFTLQRAAMFKTGWGSKGKDWFDTRAPLYRFTAQAAALRKAHRVFSRGHPTVLRSDPTGAGVIAWRMAHQPGSASQTQEVALVAFNTSDSPALADNLALNQPAGTVLKGQMGDAGAPIDAVVDAAGQVSVTLNAHGFGVWVVAKGAPPGAIRPPGNLTLQAVEQAPVSGDLPLSGQTEPGMNLQLVVNGDLGAATTITADADGRWAHRLDTSGMVLPDVPHRVVAWAADRATAAQQFTVKRQWERVADVVDPKGDDIGREGDMRYPTDPSYGARRQMDIRRTQVWRSGNALRVDVTMNEVTQIWSPQNGFDHVAFTLFLQMPGRSGGATTMPLQNGHLPDNMRWHHRIRAHGWSNAMFGAALASDENEGTTSTRAAIMQVDPATHTVSFLIAPNAMGNPLSTRGVKLYLNTWDYDGGYRAMAKEPGPYVMGAPARRAKVMDETTVIELP